MHLNLKTARLKTQHSLLLLPWEPALADTFALFEEFKDAPEAGEGGNAKDGGDDNILNHARGNSKGYAYKQKHPPATYAKVVLRLDDDGVKKTNYKECGKAYKQSAEVHKMMRLGVGY